VTGKQVMKAENVDEVLGVMATAALMTIRASGSLRRGSPLERLGGGLIAVSPASSGIAAISPAARRAATAFRAEGDCGYFERARRKPVRIQAALALFDPGLIHAHRRRRIRDLELPGEWGVFVSAMTSAVAVLLSSATTHPAYRIVFMGGARPND